MCPLMLFSGRNRRSVFPEPQNAAGRSAFRHHYYNIDRTAHSLFYAKFIKKMRTGVRIFINNHMKGFLLRADPLFIQAF